MADYSNLLGKRVELYYRTGHIYLLVNGTLVGDSGRSIFLEEHYSHHGSVKTFRWEIPYPCIVRLEETYAPAEESPIAVPVGSSAGAPIIARFTVKHLPENA